MSLRSRILPALLPVWLVLAPAPARAHEFWLAPAAWRAAPGDTVAFGARVGEGFLGEARRYAPARAVRLVARAARELDLRPVAAPGDTLWARFAPADAGGLRLGYESDFAALTLEAARFDRYLADEGLDAPLAARRAAGDTTAGRERYRRCATAWLAGDDPDRATRPLGLACEIVPLTPPGAGPTLAVRVLFEGRPLAGALLRAWHRPPAPARGAAPAPAPVAWSGRTDARGEARVPVAAAGEWLLGAVHMVTARDRAVADWESTWASLVFRRATDGR